MGSFSSGAHQGVHLWAGHTGESRKAALSYFHVSTRSETGVFYKFDLRLKPGKVLMVTKELKTRFVGAKMGGVRENNHRRGLP